MTFVRYGMLFNVGSGLTQEICLSHLGQELPDSFINEMNAKLSDVVNYQIETRKRYVESLDREAAESNYVFDATKRLVLMARIKMINELLPQNLHHKQEVETKDNPTRTRVFRTAHYLKPINNQAADQTGIRKERKKEVEAGCSPASVGT